MEEFTASLYVAQNHFMVLWGAHQGDWPSLSPRSSGARVVFFRWMRLYFGLEIIMIECRTGGRLVVHKIHDPEKAIMFKLRF